MSDQGPTPGTAGPDTRRLFVSYSRKDREVASRVSQLLRVTGATVFRDEDSIRPGTRWTVVLETEIRAAGCVIVFWSAAAAASGEVRKEYLAAVELGKDVLPLLLDDTPLPAELAVYQWLDFRDFVTLRAGVSRPVWGRPLRKLVLGVEAIGRFLRDRWVALWAALRRRRASPAEERLKQIGGPKSLQELERGVGRGGVRSDDSDLERQYTRMARAIGRRLVNAPALPPPPDRPPRALGGNGPAN
jgi:hypothetical protein